MDRIGCLVAIIGFCLFLVGLSDTGGDLLNIPMMAVGFVVAFAGTCFFLAAPRGGNSDTE
jgi:hypothetical protein